MSARCGPLKHRTSPAKSALRASSTEGHIEDATPEQIALCRNGNPRTWEKLVETSYDRVYFICYRFTESHPEAEDLTQEVFMKVFCNLHHYDAEKGSFRIWLKNVTRNHLVDHYRRTRLDRLSSSLDEPNGKQSTVTFAELLADTRPSQEDNFLTLETHARVHDALQQLSPIARNTAMLCFIDERKYSEAADILGIAEGTVKSRLSRARAELSPLLSMPQLVQV